MWKWMLRIMQLITKRDHIRLPRSLWLHVTSKT